MEDVEGIFLFFFQCIILYLSVSHIEWEKYSECFIRLITYVLSQRPQLQRNVYKITTSMESPRELLCSFTL